MTASEPLPTWDEMTDLDKGAAISYLYRCDLIGIKAAAANYAAEYFDDPRLVALGATPEASAHALVIAERAFEDLAECARLHTVAIDADAARSRARFESREVAK